MRQTEAILISNDWCSGPISRTIAVIRETRPSRLLARILLIGCLAIIVSGIGHALTNPAREESREVADLVVGLSERSDRVALVPSGLSSSLGYEPVTANGTLAKPSGGCSTPIPLGPDSFEHACRTHDLGYDLLRSAEEDGHRLGVWARFELDRRFYLDLVSTCETLRCRTAAATYYTAVTTNSIRQGYGAPTDEPTTPWVGVALLVVCFALLTDPRKGLRAMAGRVATRGQIDLPIDSDRTVSESFVRRGSEPGLVARLRLFPVSGRVKSVASVHLGPHRSYHRSSV